MSITLPAGLTREPIDPRDRWIVDAARAPIGIARYDGTELYFEQADKSGAGSPVGVVTPDFVGQQYFDTYGEIHYTAHGTSSKGWRQSSFQPKPKADSILSKYGATRSVMR